MVQPSGSLLANVGNTPLIRLQRVTQPYSGVEIHAKAEYFNPGGSVKDRPALRMIEDGERSGRLTKGKTIIDSTSGNTGIAYAMIAAIKGYPVRLCLPRNASPERKRILKAYGADIVFTDPAEGFRRSDPQMPRTVRLPIQSVIFIPINTIIPPIGARISIQPALRSWPVRKAASAISSRRLEPVEPSWAFPVT